MLNKLIGCLFITSITINLSVAQRQLPPSIPAAVDSLLDRAFFFKDKEDTINTNKTVEYINSYVDQTENTYPVYTGLIRLFQSYYTFDFNKRIGYKKIGLQLIGSSGTILADSFIYGLYNVMMMHYNSGRMEEWQDVDSVFRESVAKTKITEGSSYVLLNYSNKLLINKQYELSKKLSTYDYYLLMSRNSELPMDKLSLIYVDWLILKADLDKWLTLTYYQKYEDEYSQSSGQQFPSYSFESQVDDFSELKQLDFSKSFKILLSRIKELTEDLVAENRYDSKDFDPLLRQGYYNIYYSIISGFYSWAIRDQKEGQVILSLKEFLYQDVIPNEIVESDKANKKPVISSYNLVSLFTNLANLYDGVGNGTYELATVSDGIKCIKDYAAFSQEEIFIGTVNLLNVRYRANRLQGNYNESLKDIRFLKKYAPFPPIIYDSNKVVWERYMNIHIEEVYTILAQNKISEARDSFAKLLNDITTKSDSSDESIYKSNFWPELQYLVATFQAYKGNWNSTLISECIKDIDRDRTYLPIFFPVQLLYLKATWHNDKILDKGMLSNLLFYTGSQLKNTFPMLSAEDRMKLFEQRLSEYFDIYHELLFSGHLNQYPLLKEKVIAQSLSLKNALADGNLVPNSTLLKNNTKYSEARVEKIRELRQESNLILQRSKMNNYQTDKARSLQDRTQTMWLNLLDEVGMDSLTKQTEWQTISRKLKSNEVYTETIRYTKWLSDSTSAYGAYIISPGEKIEVRYLFKESYIQKLLLDPSASPQTMVLNDDGNRNAFVASSVKNNTKFNEDSTDKLAILLLSPFSSLIETNKEWYMVNDGLLNRISFAALKLKDGYLFKKINLKLLSASNSLKQGGMNMPQKPITLLAGGLDYGTSNKDNNNCIFKSEYVWNYLPGTVKEIENLTPVFEKAQSKTTTLVGMEFQDTIINILKNYEIIHLATHGFYLDSSGAVESYKKNMNQSSIKDEPLFRCGIAVSSANSPDKKVNIHSDGFLLGYEIANTDLRKCYLISLSACETGLGDLRNNLGVDGLSRALKIAGVKNLLISLWKVPDQPTAVFMKLFYENLFATKSPAQALKATQTIMSVDYPVSDWAAFILVE